MTLLAEIQEVMERTYAAAGINLEECLIGPARRRQLGTGLEGNSDAGCTYLRCAGDRLYIAIYYAPELIETLEAEDPRESLSHRNIGPFITFIEEITHGVHAALAFRQGFRRIDSEGFLCGLEAQARVDTYLLLARFVHLLSGSVDGEARRWLKARLFDDERFDHGAPRLGRRYRTASLLARDFVDRLERQPAGERVARIREFRGCDLLGKRRLVRAMRTA
jgi:hypothetical protein